MELIKLPKLNHSCTSLAGVFGLTRYEEDYIKTAIIFEILSSRILVSELFTDIKDAPDDMTTMTGIFQRAFNHAKTGQQQLLLTLEYHNAYQEISSAVVDMITKKPEKESAKGDLKEDIGALLKKLIDKIQYVPYEMAMKTILECNHDFDAFCEKMIPRKKYDADGKRSDKSDSKEKSIDELIQENLRANGMDFSIDEDEEED